MADAFTRQLRLGMSDQLVACLLAEQPEDALLEGLFEYFASFALKEYANHPTFKAYRCRLLSCPVPHLAAPGPSPHLAGASLFQPAPLRAWGQRAQAGAACLTCTTRLQAAGQHDGPDQAAPLVQRGAQPDAQDHLPRGPHQQRQDVPCPAGAPCCLVCRPRPKLHAAVRSPLQLLCHSCTWRPSCPSAADDGTCCQALKAAKSGIYCGPLRLLAMEIYDQLNADGLFCNLLTGGAPSAPVCCPTSHRPPLSVHGTHDASAGAGAALC